MGLSSPLLKKVHKHVPNCRVFKIFFLSGTILLFCFKNALRKLQHCVSLIVTLIKSPEFNKTLKHIFIINPNTRSLKIDLTRVQVGISCPQNGVERP